MLVSVDLKEEHFDIEIYRAVIQWYPRILSPIVSKLYVRDALKNWMEYMHIET
jgi:hypothetical protein